MARTKEYLKALLKESGGKCVELLGKCQKCKEDVNVLYFSDGEVEGNGGIIVGDGWDSKPEFKCSKCLEQDGNQISPTRTEVFSRVCGYLRPVQAYNPGKKAEFADRQNYKFEEKELIKREEKS